MLCSAPFAASRENSQAKHLAQGKGASAVKPNYEAQFITQEMGFSPLTISNTLRRQKQLSLHPMPSGTTPPSLGQGSHGGQQDGCPDAWPQGCSYPGSQNGTWQSQGWSGPMVA